MTAAGPHAAYNTHKPPLASTPTNSKVLTRLQQHYKVFTNLQASTDGAIAFANACSTSLGYEIKMQLLQKASSLHML